MKHLVIGLGEVGMAIQKVFGCGGVDSKLANEPVAGVDVMHICFPYSENFAQYVGEYEAEFKPKYIVVHSTVPVGTCEKLGANHSPIRGKHPHLAESIKIFRKFIGGPDAETLAEEFNRFMIHSFAVPNSRDTEAMKLWDTTQYGVMISLEKEIHEFCEKNQLDFNVVYTEANITYNKGYEKMNVFNVRRPVLKHTDGKIGGHCVVQNCALLDSPSAKKILSDNSQ